MLVIFKCLWAKVKMAGKEKESHVRRWTKEEEVKSVEVLADLINGFAFCLDRLALEKSSNDELYEHIKKNFDKALEKKEFIEINEKNNFKDKGKVKDYKKLDTSITRIRSKFKSLKSDWCKLHSRIKRGSGLAPSNKPLWFKHMDPIFSETNAEIRLSSSAHEISFAQEGGESDDSDSNEKDSRENIIQTYKQIEVVDNEDVGDQHQSSSQGSQDKPYVKPINQEAPEGRCELLSLLTKNQSKSDQTNRL